MAWPKAYSPEDSMGRNRSPEWEARDQTRLHGDTFSGLSTMSPYGADNPDSIANTSALRQRQRDWVNKMKLIEKAERAAKSLKNAKRGMIPGMSKAAMWSLVDRADEANKEVEDYFTRRENLKKLMGGRKGRVIRDPKRQKMRMDPLGGIRGMDEGRHGGYFSGMGPGGGYEPMKSYGESRWSPRKKKSKIGYIEDR